MWYGFLCRQRVDETTLLIIQIYILYEFTISGLSGKAEIARGKHSRYEVSVASGMKEVG